MKGNQGPSFGIDYYYSQSANYSNAVRAQIRTEGSTKTVSWSTEDDFTSSFHHVFMTYASGSEMTLYVDGEVKDAISVATVNDFSPNSGSSEKYLTLGGKYVNGGNRHYFNGFKFTFS